MSLVLGSIDVSVAPTLGLDLGISSPAEDKPGPSAAAVVPVPCLSGFLKRDGEGRAKLEIGRTFGGGELETKPEPSSETSSIGVPSDSDEEEEEEVESKPSGSLGCLGSLEESLPIKSGLSNYFSGKSKSFANLSGVDTVKEIEKKENPLNKRRRIMIAYKWPKKPSFYGLKNPTSMPLLALNEEEDGDNNNNNNQGENQDSSSKDEEEEDGCEEEEGYKLHKRKQHLMGFKSCFSLADLQE